MTMLSMDDKKRFGHWCSASAELLEFVRASDYRPPAWLMFAPDVERWRACERMMRTEHPGWCEERDRKLGIVLAVQAQTAEAKLARLEASLWALAAKWRAGIDANWEDYPIVEQALDELLEAVASAGEHEG